MTLQSKYGYRVTMNKAEQLALKRLYDRLENPAISYRQFRRTVKRGWECWMVQMWNMWIGIENDGYTHS